MGTIVIGTIVDAARRTLFELKVGADSAADKRWDRTRELLPRAVAAQRAIVGLKPEAGSTSVAFQLGAGAKQTIPSNGLMFLSVDHNLGANGSTVGPAINRAYREDLTRVNPEWPTATGAAVVRFLHDPRDPKTFYVYPRPSGTWYVNLLYVAIPATVAAGDIDTATISVDDIYDTAIHDFTVGYSILKNFRAGEANKASMFLERFRSTLGIQNQAELSLAALDDLADLNRRRV